MKRPIFSRVLIGNLTAVLVAAMPVLVAVLIVPGIARFAIVLVLLFGIIGGLIVSAVFTRQLSAPIRELIVACKRVNSGDYDARVYLGQSDELSELAGTFNRMTQQIGESITRLSEQREELDAIVVSSGEGLIVLDERERVVLANESFRVMMQNSHPEGRYYWELVRSTCLVEGVEKARSGMISREVEFVVDEKTLIATITPLVSRRRIMIAFKDVTEVRRVEKVKRDFIVNVSHELRTPLTTIKGFVDILRDSVNEEHQRYVMIVARNTDRLANIVEDLLQLAKVTEVEDTPGSVEANVAEVFAGISGMFEQRFQEKGLIFRAELPNETPLVSIDSFKLEQVLINLVDNALKYTEEGEVSVSAGPSAADEVLIMVEDTGIGIARKHLARLFERFYVVDQSRSRELGGTGLGLSIVKHIVASAGGSINVESTLGVGSKFMVRLPAAHRLP